jgi:hypothetical protein
VPCCPVSLALVPEEACFVTEVDTAAGWVGAGIGTGVLVHVFPLRSKFGGVAGGGGGELTRSPTFE